MEQQTSTIIEDVQPELETEQDFFEFADLSLTDEQLAGVKGGPGGGFGCSVCSGGLGNHNETMAEDATEAAEDDFFQFADLSLTDEQLAEVKGGPGGGFNCPYCGGGLGNHNETTAEDDEAETEVLADLPVEDGEQVKGGPGGLGGISVNHNETIVADGAAETAELNDLPVNADQQAEVIGGDGITKFGSRRLILQGDGAYV